MIGRGFDLVLSNPLKQLFQDSEDVRLRAWGVSELGAVDYIRLESSDEWFIAPDGEMNYYGLHKDEEAVRMPTWFKRARLEWCLR